MPCPVIDRVVEVYCGKLLAAVWGLIEQGRADVAVACHDLHLFKGDVQGIQPVIDHALPDAQRIDCRFRNKLPPPYRFKLTPYSGKWPPLANGRFRETDPSG